MSISGLHRLQVPSYRLRGCASTQRSSSTAYMDMDMYMDISYHRRHSPLSGARFLRLLQRTGAGACEVRCRTPCPQCPTVDARPPTYLGTDQARVAPVD